MNVARLRAWGAIALWLVCTAGAGAQSGGASLDGVLDASRSALGLSALPAIHALREDVTGTIAGIKGTGTQWQDVRSGAYTQTIDAGPLPGSNGFDGTRAWNEDRAGLVFDDGSPDARYTAIDTAYLNRYALWSPGYGGAAVTLGPQQEAGAKRYDVLTIAPAESLPFELWIDAATHLPSKTVQKIGTTTTTTTLGDYRPLAGGLQVPFAVDIVNEQAATNLKVTAAALDPAGALEHLTRPVSHARDFSIAGGSETTIPFELIDNHVYLPVTINGKGPYQFIFDTGASNVLDAGIAKEIGLIAQGNVQGGGVGVGTESFNFGQIATLKIGGATLVDQSFAYGAVRQGFGIASSRSADGLIGFEVLARYQATFDYARKLVTLRMPSASPDLPGTRVPFRFHGSTPDIACTIGGQPGRCTVDTGSRASLSVASPFVAAHASIVPADATAPGVDGFGVGGPALGRLGRTTLQIGGFDLAGVVTDFSVQQQGAFADPFTAGNIGGGVWRRFTLTFDYAHETLALLPNESLGLRDAYDRSGFFLIDRNGAIVVADARPGTPAAGSGVLKGESIKSVNGQSAATLGLGGIRQLFLGATGTKLQLEVSGKDGTVRPVTLVLSDYV
jgi:hypothetical protein